MTSTGQVTTGATSLNDRPVSASKAGLQCQKAEPTRTGNVKQQLRIAIVGCGKIADSHIAQLSRIRSCELVAVCDREVLMAQQLAERAGVRHYFNDIDQLLAAEHPDVVHIATPPQSHFELGRYCLEHGCHVYIEKPFTLTAAEARTLIATAEKNQLRITAGHDDQFRHAARRMRRLIRDGYLGGPPVHMESYYCYELNYSSDYARAILADKTHWVRKLPGGLLHNVISHGIARIAEFLSEEAKVTAVGFVSPRLQSMGETELVDELRVIVNDRDQLTAYFTFSSQMRPSLHQFRIYGPRNALVLDQDQETLIKLPGGRYKSYLEQFIPPLALARQYCGSALTNFRTFLAGDFHMKSGMKYLFEAFYDSILRNLPPPIPYREILLTSSLMDQIFEQIELATSTKSQA